MIRKPALQWLALLSLSGLAGCGGPEGPQIVEVSGTVTRNGNPVPNLFLNFMPDGGRPSWGVTDEHGQFTLTFSKDQKGAIVGTHKVFVAFRPRSPQEEMDFMRGKAKTPEGLQEILQEYGNAEKTPLRVEVKEHGQVIDIEL